MGPAQSGSLSTAQARAERRKLPQRNSASILSIVEHCAPQDSPGLRSWLHRVGLYAHISYLFPFSILLRVKAWAGQSAVAKQTTQICIPISSDFIRFSFLARRCLRDVQSRGTNDAKRSSASPRPLGAARHRHSSRHPCAAGGRCCVCRCQWQG